MTKEDQDRIKVIDEWIAIFETKIRDLVNEKNKIILKGDNHEQ